MNDTAPKEQGILLIAAVFGFIGGAVAFVVYGWGLPSSALVALIVAAIVAVVLWLGWRAPKGRPVGAGTAPVAHRTSASSSGAAPATSSGAAASSSGAASATSSGAAASSSGTAPATSSGAAASSSEAAQATLSGAAASSPGAAPAASSGAAASSSVGDASPVVSDTEPTSHAGGAGAAIPAVGGADAATTAGASSAAAKPTSALKPSARLAGQEELASRKGSWTYNARGASAAAAQPDAAASSTVVPTATAAEEDAFDETRPDVGDKPQMLSAPREGGPDNLKEIKGVGPKLEDTLHEMGVYHFDQIAGWTDTEVAWMDNNLRGFKGRVSRDGWIAQARILAAGGDTEFSSRVDKGGVYDA